MITKLDTETTKQYQALCDFWRLGPGRSINQLYKQYKTQTNPAAKTYNTLKNWSVDNDWEKRIAQNIADEQKMLEEMYKEELIENCKRRYSILNDMFKLTQSVEIEFDGISVSEAKSLYKAYLDATGKVFNLDAPEKIALTDPSGKREYKGNVDELIKLADAAKRRPD